LTPETFAKGIKYYLTAMQHKAATPADLHRALQKAYDEDFPENGINIDELMRTWEALKGYPVIRVEKSGGKFILTQSNDNFITIPITYSTKSNPKFGKESPKIWMKTKVIEIEAASDDDWIILNPNLHGFYDGEYSDETMLNLFDTLETNVDLIPPRVRTQFFDELLNRFNKELLPVSAGFKLFDYLKHETEITSLLNFGRLESYFNRYLIGTDVYGKYEQLIQSLVRPHMLKFLFKEVSGEPNTASINRDKLIEISCKYNLPECLEHQFQEMETKRKTKYIIFNFCDGMKSASEATFMEILKMVEASRGSRSVEYHSRSLACTNNGTLLKIFLDKMLEKSNLDFFLNPIGEVMSRNPKGAEIVLDVVIENFDALVAK
jgi:hypothetical protein